jgi:two-component system OmpR family sensor kinase
MSSNPPAEQVRRRGRLLAGRPLRTRLIAAMVALLAVVCLVVSVVTVVALRHALMERLDSQLADAGSRAAGPAGGPDDDQGPGPPRHERTYCNLVFLGGGNEPGTLGACVSGGQATAQVVAQDTSGEVTQTDLGSSVTRILASVPVDNHKHTRDLGDLGSYRLLARNMPSGDRVVVGLPLAPIHDTLWTVVEIEAIVAVAGMITAAGIGILIVRRTLRPLRRVAATATRVSELPLDRGEVALPVRVPAADTDPRTEVGQVGAALNRMLGHVANALAARQASETRVRQFVADASHELRTPLAAIRGYAELTRRGRDEVPPDVAHALRRVESESARMTSLVEDLLLLARLDSGRPIEHEPVDLSRLIVDAVSDAHAAGPDHRWHLDLPAESITVPGDVHRLHQVLANLLANARAHTPPGTNVTIGLRVDEEKHAVLQVTDNGPGIPAELQPEVFERFARGDSSRSRAAGSTGLGLAIVAAVVEAHHGHVEVESRPGRTAFTVRLPLS